MGYLTADQWRAAYAAARRLDAIERVRISLGLQMGRLAEHALLPPLLIERVDGVQDAVSAEERIAERELGALLKGSPLFIWVEHTPGLAAARAGAKSEGPSA